MSIIAERTDTAVEVSTSVTDLSGGVSGLTIAVSVYDRARTGAEWLNLTTGAWQATQNTKNMDEVGTTGLYVTEIDTHTATGNHLAVFFEVTTAGYEAISQETLVLVDTLHNIAAPGDAMSLTVGAVDAAAIATGAIDADAFAAGAITAAVIATDAIDADAIAANAIDATAIASGAITSAKFQANAINAAAIAPDAITSAKIATGAIGANELAADGIQAIRNAILADGTAFNGASIATILQDTSTDIPATLTTIGGNIDSILVDTGTDIPATLAALALEATLTDMKGPGFDPVTDSLEDIKDAVTAGGTDPQVIRDALKLAPSVGAPAAGSIDQELNDMQGAGFLTATDSLEAIRDRGDAAWGGADANLLLGYFGAIWIDTINGTAGAVLGTNGTPNSPVNNAADALTLAGLAGLRRYHLTGALTLGSAHTNWHFMGVGNAALNIGALNVGGSFFQGLTVTGAFTASAETFMRECVMDACTQWHGTAVRCVIRTSHSLRAGVTGRYIDCRNPAAINIPVDGGIVQWVGGSGYQSFTNMTNAGAVHYIHADSGPVVLNNTNTAGTVIGGGNSRFVNSSTMVVNETFENAAYTDDVLGGAHGAGTWDVAGLATAADLATVDTVVDAILVDTAAGGPGPWTAPDVSGLATAAALATVDTVVDAILVDTAAGGPGPWTTADVSGLATAASLATVDTVVDAILVDTGTDIPASFTQIKGAGWNPATDTLESIYDSVTAGGTDPVVIAQAVWNADETLYNDPSTMGELLHGAGGGSSPGAVAAAVWSEAQAGYVVPGTFGFNLDAEVSGSGASINPQDVRDAMLLFATGGEDPIDNKLNDLENQVVSRASQAAVDAIDAIVDAILADTSAGGPGPWTTADLSGVATAAALAAVGADVDAVLVDTTEGGAGPWTAPDVSGLATAAALAVVDTNVDAILVDTTEGGPGPWQTGAGGDPLVYASAVWGALKMAYNDPATFGEVMNNLDLGSLDTNGIIEALNAQTSLLLAACDNNNEGCQTPILPPVYTGHKGDNLIVPVYRNGTLMPDTELANGTQFSMTIRNITTNTTFNVTEVAFVGTGHLSYVTRAGDGIFETKGKWEYQADGLTEQGQPFESLRLTVRVYDDV